MAVTLRLPALLCLALAATGCGDAPDRSAESAPLATLEEPAEVRRDTVVIRRLSPGDRACYVEVDDGLGMAREERAGFELCERGELIGRRVELTVGPGEVPAASCEGDPACPRRDTVRMVQSAREIP